MRIMTSNIWGDYFGNPVELREDQLFNVFKKYNPDILGVQEARMSFQKSKLFKKLGEEYAAIGVSDYEPVNHEPLFYKKKYKLIESGFEYLLDTPDLTKGITFAVLYDEESDKKFAVCNTHFWYKDGAEHDLIRVTNAKQIVSRMKYLLTKEDAEDLISSLALNELEWIENDSERLTFWREILRSGDRTKIAALIRTLYLRSQHLTSLGKHLRSADAQIFKEAQSVLHGELATVFDIPLEEVENFITEKSAAK